MVATDLLEVKKRATEWYGREIFRFAPTDESSDVTPPLPPLSYWTATTDLIQSAVKGVISSFNCNPPQLAADTLTRRSGSGNTTLSRSGLAWVLHNPYVRGRHERRSAVSNVRSLLALVPVVESIIIPPHPLPSIDEGSPLEDDSNNTSGTSVVDPTTDTTAWLERSLTESVYSSNSDHTATATNIKRPQQLQVSAHETASQLAEGTIRALRDLALDEAVELQEALRYWNSRWERPFLSWLEAGPVGMSLILFVYICLCLGVSVGIFDACCSRTAPVVGEVGILAPAFLSRFV
jgi:hypothetical protein